MLPFCNPFPWKALQDCVSHKVCQGMEDIKQLKFTPILEQKSFDQLKSVLDKLNVSWGIDQSPQFS